MRFFLILLIAGLLAACARPVGDFGRAAPSATHDEIMPAAGNIRAKIFQEPVSWFNFTDEEIEMHDRIWRFIIAPHAGDWFFNIIVEWQRTRLIPPLDTVESYDRYYAVLRSERYQSSRVRYARIVRDIRADLDTMPGVFAVICKVEEIDRRRATAAEELASGDEWQLENAVARRAENDHYIDWFVSSARYRYDSYTYALEHLLVETPHEEARVVDRYISDLAIRVEQAERHDFCSPAQAAAIDAETDMRPSRFVKNPFGDPNYRK